MFGSLVVLFLSLSRVKPQLLSGTLNLLTSDHFNLPSSISITNGSTFDYIVVGGGAAGCAAASRLALAGYDTLLVEGGANPSALSKIPAAAMVMANSRIDWSYKTISNGKSCKSSSGGQCTFNRGKCLGGSTAINYMMYTRGNHRDFDDLGVPGWSSADMEPYFLRYEALQDLYKLPSSSASYHNTSGIMPIEIFPDSGDPWQQRILDGMNQLNFSVNYDVNAETQIGVSHLVGYVYNGERMTTARAYLTRDDIKAKLKVTKNTRCTGIILNDDNEALGVTVQRGLDNFSLFVKKEIILSAGTVGTAQLLLLSGFGPAEHLQEMGIKVRKDLPVGENLSDHVLPLMLIAVDQDISVSDILTVVVDGITWLSSRQGSLDSPGLTVITAFANTLCYDNTTRQLGSGPDCEIPTMQFIFAAINRGTLALGGPIAMLSSGLDADAIAQLIAINNKRGLIVVNPVVLRPESRGMIKLASTDPLDDPAIYPNYLDDDADMQEILRGVRIVEDLAATEAFQKHNASLVRLTFPGCPEASEWAGYWACYARHMTHSVQHATGVVALAAVVTARLAVRGARRLRAADLGVLPLLPRGNTAAAAIAIGERVSDLILEDNGEDDIFL